MPIMSPYTKKVERNLFSADFLIITCWCFAASYFPASLHLALTVVMCLAWLLGQKLVGGQNPRYLTPRWRIYVSMGLSLAAAVIAGILWAGSGHEWHVSGGLLNLVVLGGAGILVRLAFANFYQRTGMQLVPFRIAPAHLPLLKELSAHKHVFIEPVMNDASEGLPPHDPKIPIYMAITDLRLAESESHDLLPLLSRIETADLMTMYESVLGKVAMVYDGQQWMLPRALQKISPFREQIKRAADIIFVIVTAPLTIPIMISAAIAMKISSPGPVFFYQKRVGQYGKIIRIRKLRTMTPSTESDRPHWSKDDDERVTKVGRWLRATGIDELPQFWNILRGEMSLIGPRPEVPEIAEKLEQRVPFYRMRLLVLPGLSGWSQLYQGGDATLDDVNQKLRHDLYYLKYGNLFLDITIFLGTLQMILHMAKPAPCKAPAPAEETRNAELVGNVTAGQYEG